MGQIVDKQQRPWSVDIDVTTLSRVRKRLDVNLLELVLHDNKLIEKLADPVLLVDVLFVLCEEQCKTLGVSDEDFGRSLTRDSVDHGLDLILEGVVNFSPRALRPAYQKVLEKARKFQAAQAEKIQAGVTTPEFDAAMDAEIGKLLDRPATSPTDASTAAGSLAASQG